jgi:hypothetical protein
MGWIPFKGKAVDELSRWHAFRKDQPAGAPTRGGNRNAEPKGSPNEPGLCGGGKKGERCRGAARRRSTAGPAARRPACSRNMRRRGTAWAAADECPGRPSRRWLTGGAHGGAGSAVAARPQLPDRYTAAADRRWASGAIGGGARRPSGPETVTSQDADPVSMLMPAPSERAQMGAARWHSSAI